MKPLDVINSVDFGYRLVWTERHYLLRLAAVPVAIKLVCFLVLVLLEWDQNFLRRGLVLLPSFFAEGWMLSHLVRLIFYGQRWPFRATGDKAQDHIMLMDRAYGIMAGTLFYVVIRFLTTGGKAILMAVQGAAESELTAVSQAQAEPSAGIFFAALSFLVLTLWCFRFIFLYIPAAAGLSGKVITGARQGLILSIQMLGTWLVCFVPLVLILFVVASALIPAESPGTSLPFTTSAVLLLVQVLVDTLIPIVSTGAIAAGLRNMIEKPDSSR